MSASYSDLLGFVQHLTPTWRKTQHINFTLLLAALLERPTLCLSELARAYPSPMQPLHGRLKRLGRFLDNPNLDEAALFVRWLKLAYRFGDDPPNQDTQYPLLPVLLDTTYFEPFAMLVATVPCGSRGLPVALTTYHRNELRACFPPEAAWPHPNDDPLPPRPRRGQRIVRPGAVPTPFLSQNHIEERLIDYVFSLLSTALHGVLVADRGFARASLFRRLQARQRDFDIRMDAQTHIRLPSPLAPDRPAQGEPGIVLGLRPGQRIWCPQAWYGQEDQVPISLLALWDVGQKEPWYLASSLQVPEHVETLYRWRMRLELANRDEKTGVLLRESGDSHALSSLLHMHRLLLALAAAEWLCALTGLQARRDLPASPSVLAGAALWYVSSPANSSQECSDSGLADSTSQTESSPIPSQTLAAGPPEPRDPAQRYETSRPEQRIGAMPTSEARTDECLSATQTPQAENETTGASPGASSKPTPPDEGPASPPPVLPHRGQTPKVPPWMRPFAARGHLSYVRLGLEVLRSHGLGDILHRMVRWLGDYLSFWTPLWRDYQIRYRLKNWWVDSS